MIYETDCFALQMNFVNIYVKMTQTLAGDADAFKPLSPSLPACLSPHSLLPLWTNWMTIPGSPWLHQSHSAVQWVRIGTRSGELWGFRIKNQRQLWTPTALSRSKRSCVTPSTQRVEDEHRRRHRIGFLPFRPLFCCVWSGHGDGPGAGRWSR